MSIKKFFISIYLMFLCSLFLSNYVYAKILTIEDKGEYIIGDGVGIDMPTAKKGAFEDAQTNAARQAGTYIYSRSKVVKSKLTEDEFIVMTAAIMKPYI